jgi:hypothetical protein
VRLPQVRDSPVNFGSLKGIRVDAVTLPRHRALYRASGLVPWPGAAVDGQNVLRCDIRHSITWSTRSMAVGNVFAEETLGPYS